MALGRSNTPVTAPAPTVTESAPAPKVEAATAPAPLFSFEDDVTVPGRGNGSNAMETDAEYLALKDKLAQQRLGHINGSLAKDKGTVFPSNDVKKHVRYLRAAADALGIGVSIKTPEGNTGKISFRAKDRKVYTKTATK